MAKQGIREKLVKMVVKEAYNNVVGGWENLPLVTTGMM